MRQEIPSTRGPKTDPVEQTISHSFDLVGNQLHRSFFTPSTTGRVYTGTVGPEPGEPRERSTDLHMSGSQVLSSSSASGELNTPPAGKAVPTGSPWILGPAADLLLFVATPVLIIPLVILSRQRFSDQAIYALVGSLGATGHHLPGLLRAYGDRALFQRFRIRFTVAPILLVSISVPLLYTNLREGMEVLLVLWGFWHGLMQVYGFLRIYATKSSQSDALSARLDWLMCLAWFGTGMVCSDGRVFQVLETFYRAGGPLVPSGWVAGFRYTWLVGTGLVSVVFLARLLSQKSRFQPATGVRLLTMAISFAFWWYAMVMVDSIIVGIAIFEIFHDIQYLAIVWVFNRKRVQQASDVGGFTRFLFRRNRLMLVIYVGLVAAYGLGGSLPKYLGAPAVQELMIAIIWTSTLLHFYFDGFIWKVREEGTRAGLGLAISQQTHETRPLTTGLIHALKWTPLVAVLVLLGVTQWWNDFVFGQHEARDQQIRQRYRNLVKIVPGYDHAHLTLGTQLREQGKLDEALLSLNQALEVSHGHNTEAHFQMALLLTQRQDPDGVISHHRRVLAREPNRTDAHLGLALALQSRGRHEEAERHLRESLSIDENYPATRIGLGRLYLETGRVQEAEKQLQQAVTLLHRLPASTKGNRQLLQTCDQLLRQARDQQGQNRSR